MTGVMEIGATAAIHLFGEQISSFSVAPLRWGFCSVVSAMVMTGPRIYYAMSRDGVFFPIFGKLDSVHKTPATSIFLQAAIAVVMVLSASFEALLIYIGFTLSLIASLTVIGLMRIRWTGAGNQKKYKTWGYPVTPLVFILCKCMDNPFFD